jgi:uncharacterized protein YndB with AHSA1/START domain
MQLMGCNNDHDEELTVERELELDAPVDVVWEELPALFDGDDDRATVVDEIDPARRLAFWWAPATDADPPSYVEVELTPSGVGTLIRVRETRLDGAHLERSVRSARAYA